mmetsp:Transcript_16437/g.41223  ORF Transcript_16437/g.41223 Transcript_16437/m.41223 type:complete len:549 (+) Transcript_16437:327-1973(+)|eukprot:CAMPEP_0116097646 /NCGR_PEP_ID=MMETSP0327-20121206/10817_1 /TAXON_ID=44447 /ORGANISM="Pseudo-nitzschia delicatissima, Strain B596" /LENGTH=548 /DNA_ID=CAMNT_0003589413 /DNA_START=237 /DNA_END=1883 /DNA_ORIENTATION=-
MNTPQVIHHTDYRSKAEDRRRELEKLQEKRLAKTQAAQLRHAPIPIEACNFMKKQRELFEMRRKNQADAIEFLHQFRADDDFVLRSARRSLGSKNDNQSATPKKQLEPGQEPDARAAVYSYAVYPMLTQTMNSRAVTQDNISNDSPSLQSATNPPKIIESSIPFQYAFELLEAAAKEASKHPLPEDSDVENDNENLEKETGTLDNLVQCTDQASIQCDGNGNGGDGVWKDEKKSGLADDAAQSSLSGPNSNNGCGDNDGYDDTTTENGECNPILILEGEFGDDIISSPNNDSVGDVDTAMSSFIPFEAFSKLGESLVLESQNVGAFRNHDDGLSFQRSESDDESSIPGHSFMQLGASMMANDLSSTSKDDEKDPIMPVKESKKASMENSDLMSNTATEVTASQVTMGSKSLMTNDGITERSNDEASKAPSQVCCDDEPKQEFCGRIIDTEAIIDDTTTFENIVTPKRSNRNIATCDNDGMNCAEDQVEENEDESKKGIESTNQEPQPVGGDEAQTSLRRNGTRKKKKKKDKFYYPSSSLFVSRQYLSR